MNKLHAVWLSLACLLVVCVASARAEERNYWRFSNGHYENVNGNKWVEKNGDRTYKFVETDRNDDYVELYCESLDASERLYSDRCMVKYSNSSAYKKLFDGHWGGN